jgi:ribosomal 30S subunit maturation factor RimM
MTDLVDSRVINREGGELGTVSGLRSSGRGAGGTQQWLEVANEQLQQSSEEQRMTLLIPLNDRYVDAVDTAAKLVRVDWHPEW